MQLFTLLHELEETLAETESSRAANHGQRACRAQGTAAMSLYTVQKLIYQLNRDPAVRQRFAQDFDGAALRSTS